MVWGYAGDTKPQLKNISGKTFQKILNVGKKIHENF
jgi:hypothetical protein